MLGTKEIVEEAESLPVEERAAVVDSLLRSLNPPRQEMDRAWAAEARKRLDDLRRGRVEAVPGKEVFASVEERFEK